MWRRKRRRYRLPCIVHADPAGCMQLWPSSLGKGSSARKALQWRIYGKNRSAGPWGILQKCVPFCRRRMRSLPLEPPRRSGAKKDVKRPQPALCAAFSEASDPHKVKEKAGDCQSDKRLSRRFALPFLPIHRRISTTDRSLTLVPVGPVTISPPQACSA